MATGDHGNARCAARPEPASASWSHSPEGEPGEAAAAAERAAGRPAAGARSGRLRVGRERKGGGLGLASVLPPPRVRASVRQSVLPPGGPSQRGGPQPSLPQTAVVKRCRARPDPASQSPRFPEAPQDPAARGGQAGACAERRLRAGPSEPGGRGEDPPGPTGSRPALRGLAGPRGRAGVAIAEDPQPPRSPLAARDRVSRNSAEGVVVSQWSPLRVRMDS